MNQKRTEPMPTEATYEEWLRARLSRTISQLDNGDMKSYPSKEARTILAERLAARREVLQ